MLSGRMKDAPERGVPSNVRGWLSEVYLPALVSAQAEQLVHRLGGRATVDDPILGRAGGMPELASYLHKAAAWFTDRSATFETQGFTTGSDRDVTEGLLTLTADGRRVALPIAVVAERRPEREVEIRLYYSAKRLQADSRNRAPLVPRQDELPVPPPVAAHLEALARGDTDTVLASFENGATVREPTGATHAKDGDGGAMRAFYDRLFVRGSGGGRGLSMITGSRADDGRTCALEYTVTRMHGTDVTPQPGLAVYERGESGLLRSVRLYHDH